MKGLDRPEVRLGAWGRVSRVVVVVLIDAVALLLLEAALPGFDAGVRVRLRASDGTATHALFTGRVESITPYRAVGARGRSPQHVRLRCVDDMAALWRVPVGAFPLLLDVAPGAQVRQRWVPVRRVGLYVPGGIAVYPSSVVMNVVPAQAAGGGDHPLAVLC